MLSGIKQACLSMEHDHQVIANFVSAPYRAVTHKAAPVDWVLYRLLPFCDSAKTLNIELVPPMVEHLTPTYDYVLKRKPKFMQCGRYGSCHAASYRVDRFGRGSVLRKLKLDLSSNVGKPDYRHRTST